MRPFQLPLVLALAAAALVASADGACSGAEPAPAGMAAPSSPLVAQEGPTSSAHRPGPEGVAGSADAQPALTLEMGSRGRSASHRHGGERISEHLRLRGTDLSPVAGAKLGRFSLTDTGSRYSAVTRGALSFSATTIPPPFDA